MRTVSHINEMYTKGLVYNDYDQHNQALLRHSVELNLEPTS